MNQRTLGLIFKCLCYYTALLAVLKETTVPACARGNRKEQTPTEVLQEPPLTSLPTPNIVSSSIKSKHKDEATCFST